MPDRNDTNGTHHRIAVAGFFGQLPVLAAHALQKAIERIMIKQINLGAVLPDSHAKIAQPLNLLRTNSPLGTALNGMMTELPPFRPPGDDLHDIENIKSSLIQASAVGAKIPYTQTICR